MEQETIAAIATPFGSGGIGIIRISGTKATAIAGQLFQRSVSRAETHSAEQIHHHHSHHLIHGYIVDGNSIVDEVLTVVMRAPHSYTKEDVVEIQSHSGAIVLSQILKLIIDHGARLAEPGEFTKRAYLNGRIDLSQAEAVADLISAKSETALEISTAQLMGGLKSEIEALVAHLDSITAEIEARIEFSDDLDDDLDRLALSDRLAGTVLEPTKNLVAQYNSGHMLRDGVRMDIVGRPNVGKSSLLNRLLLKDRAIVTHLPGTTRDLIEDCFSIEGIPILVTDTAGLHNTDNPIEIIGIQKTHENIAKSDLVLFVVDGSIPIGGEDLNIFHTIQAKRVLLVVNKMDLVGDRDTLSMPSDFDTVRDVRISALKGEGLDGLKTAVADLCMDGVEIDPGRTIIPNLRQKLALDLALGALERSIPSLQASIEDELLVEDLKLARGALMQVLGQDVEGDMLDEIFKRFCIGK